jgi:hypothetical protein
MLPPRKNAITFYSRPSDFEDLGLYGKIVSWAIKPNIKHGPKPSIDVEKLA